MTCLQTFILQIHPYCPPSKSNQSFSARLKRNRIAIKWLTSKQIKGNQSFRWIWFVIWCDLLIPFTIISDAGLSASHRAEPCVVRIIRYFTSMYVDFSLVHMHLATPRVTDECYVLYPECGADHRQLEVQCSWGAWLRHHILRNMRYVSLLVTDETRDMYVTLGTAAYKLTNASSDGMPLSVSPA